MLNEIDRTSLLQAFEKEQEAIKLGDASKTKKIFIENSKLLQRITRESGWPSPKEDSAASHHAWAIAQHSDHDPYFQLQCLGLILPEIKNSKELLTDSCYLIDRILVNFGKPQIYGTQLKEKFEPHEIANPKNVNDLRKKIGLESVEEYIDSIRLCR